MKTSFLKQTKIETSIDNDHDITMSTPVMNGRTLPIPYLNENAFMSPAFNLTPKINVNQMTKNNQVIDALQSLKGMMGINFTSIQSKKIISPKKLREIEKSEKPIIDKTKCDMDINEEKNLTNSATYSEFIRRRTLNFNVSPDNSGLAFYHNKIVKPKMSSNESSSNNLQRMEKEEKAFVFVKSIVEETKGSEVESKSKREKDDGKVSNIKSKLKQFEI